MPILKLPALVLAMMLVQGQRTPTFNRWHEGLPDQRVPWPERNVVLYPVQMAQLTPPPTTAPKPAAVEEYDLSYQVKRFRATTPDDYVAGHTVYNLGGIYSAKCPAGMRFRLQFLIGSQFFEDVWECDAHHHLRPAVRVKNGATP